MRNIWKVEAPGTGRRAEKGKRRMQLQPLAAGPRPRTAAQRGWVSAAVLRLGFVTSITLTGIAAPAMHAQYTRNPLRTISGSVSDGGHEPLRGSVVQIEAVDTMVIQTYVTDERGEYHFRNLRSDADFTLWATFRGNKSKVHAVGKFDRQLDRDIPLVIELAK